jgi:CubicO group peptidase (beta-lactamase class C family)
MNGRKPFQAMTYLLLVPLILGGCSQTQERAKRIDIFLDQLAERGNFSGSVLVARQGETLVNKGYGWADRSERTPNTPQTRYRIHWITMEFTAMATLMLENQGLLNVQGFICNYIPDCPVYWEGITIHHLLTHTSGLSDWVQPWEGEAEIPSTSLQRVEQIKGKPPYFEPGEGFRHSENGYIVLGHIIESASGQPYEDYLREHIFDPLGMLNSGLEDRTNSLAVGYKPNGEPAPPLDLLFRYSASGLYSSVEDLYLWDQALYEETFVSKEFLNKMFTGYAHTPSVDFEGSRYGYGWFIGKILDRPVYAHGGMTSGYTSMFLRFPEERVTIIVLRNIETQVYDRLEIELAEKLFE